MKYLATLFIIAGYISLCSAAVSDFSQANDAYLKGDLTQATQYYLADLKRTPTYESFYNLANTYQKREEPGKAILFYQRALWLNPSATDAQANLNVTLEKLNLLNLEVGPLSYTARLLSANAWLILICLLGWYFLFRVVALITATNRNLSTNQITFNSLLAAFLIISLWGATYHHLIYADKAIIIGDNVPIKASPTDSSNAIRYLTPGTQVKVLDTHNHYRLINTSQMKQPGWVPKESCPLICSREAI